MTLRITLRDPEEVRDVPDGLAWTVAGDRLYVTSADRRLISTVENVTTRLVGVEVV